MLYPVFPKLLILLLVQGKDQSGPADDMQLCRGPISSQMRNAHPRETSNQPSLTGTVLA